MARRKSESISEGVAISSAGSRITVTQFGDRYAKDMHEQRHDREGLVELLTQPPVAKTKHGLPYLKLASFNGTKTEKGCYRHDAAVVAVCGIEADYDAGNVSIEDAARRLEAWGVDAILYESPTATAEKHKWRVLCLLSKAIEGETDAIKSARAEMVSRLQGMLGQDAPLDGISWNLSQSYIYGQVRGTPERKVIDLRGDFIDQIVNVQEIGKANGKGNGVGHGGSPVGGFEWFKQQIDTKLRQIILDGTPGMHQATVVLSMRLANRLPQEAVQAELEALTRRSAADEDRREDRLHEVEGIVRSAFSKVEASTEEKEKERAEGLKALLEERGRPLDIRTFKARPAGPRFVWGRYMSRGTVTILSAIGGLGKSQVGLAHGLHAAVGWGFLESDTKDGRRVWYVSLEDSPDAVHVRIYNAMQAIIDADTHCQKYERHVGADELMRLAQSNFRYVDLYGAEFRVAMKVQGELMPTPDLGLLADYIESQGGADVVYVDTLIRSHSADENANDQMARVLVGYEGFARRLESAVGLLVHVPKSKGDDRTSHAARGAGAITDNARSAINITAATAEDCKGFTNVLPEWINPENPRLLRITHGKSNYAGRECPRWALLREGWVEEFVPAVSAAATEERLYVALQAWWSSDVGYKSRPLARSGIEERLESIKELSGLKKVGKRQWQAALAWGVDEGHAVPALEAVGRNPEAKFYRLNPVAGIRAPGEGAE